MLRRFVLVFVLTATLAGQLPAAYAQRQITDGAASAAASTQPASLAVSRRLADQITAAQLKDYLYFVASDEMEGRDTPSRGLDTVAKFLALNLSRWGLRPAGDNGTYFQKIALRRTRLNSAQTSVEIAGQKYKYGDDYLAQLSSAGTSGAAVGTGTGAVVYVGNGWVLKAKNMDAYQGVDVKDK